LAVFEYVTDVTIQRNFETLERLMQAQLAILIGTGDPNGAVTASPPALYLNRSGGAGTTLYVKESGAGNVGWVGK
jgi:hypothetical protein